MEHFFTFVSVIFNRNAMLHVELSSFSPSPSPKAATGLGQFSYLHLDFILFYRSVLQPGYNIVLQVF